VLIPTGDASVCSKRDTIDGGAFFAEKESNVVFVDGECCCNGDERCRLSVKSHDVL